MRILLLGATGRTGRLVLREALERGHEVQVLVRDRQKVGFSHEQLQIMQGHPADIACLAKAIQGCEAVLSLLNISRRNEFPWSPLRTPPDLISDVMKKILPLAQEEKIRRIIFTSAWGVGDSEQEIPRWFHWLTRRSNLRYPYGDLFRTEELLRSAALDWTAIRPVILTNGRKKSGLKTSLGGQPRPSLFVSRAAVASFMVDILERGNYAGQTPVISQGS